jgi:hypothetical protein
VSNAKAAKPAKKNEISATETRRHREDRQRQARKNRKVVACDGPAERASNRDERRKHKPFDDVRFAVPALVTVRRAADCVGRRSHAHRHFLCVSVSPWLNLVTALISRPKPVLGRQKKK